MLAEIRLITRIFLAISIMSLASTITGLSLYIFDYWVILFLKYFEIEKSIRVDELIHDMVIWSCLVFIPAFKVSAKLLYTDLKLAQRKFREKFEAIERSSILVVFDRNGFIVSVNNIFLQKTGYTEEEIIGKHHKTLLPPGISEELYQKFWERLQRGELVNSKETFERVTKSGESFYIRGSYNPILDSQNRVYQIIKIANDETERFKAEEELVQQNKYLEYASKILRHDMHSGINTYIPRGIRSLERRLDPEKIKELNIEAPLRLIKDGLKHSQRVYMGVKEFTNLVKEGAKLEKEETDLAELLKEYLSDTAYSDQVAIDYLPTVEVNQALFWTAIDNMIRNGLKYNDSEFKMVAIKMVDDNHLAIIDNGRGMTQDEFDLLSKPYRRRKGQKEQGSGLGLNITTAILKEHNFPLSVVKQEVGTMIRIKVK